MQISVISNNKHNFKIYFIIFIIWEINLAQLLNLFHTLNRIVTTSYNLHTSKKELKIFIWEGLEHKASQQEDFQMEKLDSKDLLIQIKKISISSIVNPLLFSLIYPIKAWVPKVLFKEINLTWVNKISPKWSLLELHRMKLIKIKKMKVVTFSWLN
jgi:hypothetical protein